MKRLILLGGGGHCHACLDVIEREAKYVVSGIVMPMPTAQKEVFGYPIIGSDDDLELLLAKTNHAIVAVGQIKSAENRKKLYQLLKSYGATLPVIQSPLSYCSERATIGEGSVLMHASLVNSGVKIGSNCIVNTQSLIEHDSIIGDHCHIAPGAKVNGGVRIGNGVFVGSGSVIKEGISIGDRAVIGAGQVVLDNVSANEILRFPVG
jgi:sugar O-acyltransferase (sialic acid O-acetyltransferase NeuD family)